MLEKKQASWPWPGRCRGPQSNGQQVDTRIIYEVTYFNPNARPLQHRQRLYLKINSDHTIHSHYLQHARHVRSVATIAEGLEEEVADG